MQWFLTLNEGGPAFKQYCEMAKVAIHTALACTSLEPHLIYDGEDNDFTRWVRGRDVRIIRWRSSLFTELADLGRRIRHPGFTAALPGIFLRVDLPLIGRRVGLDERVLYTDCDVLFQHDVIDLLEPIRCKYFAAALESNRSIPEEMNSGVMWMHLTQMACLDEQFRAYIADNIDGLPASSWDQGVYRAFYRARDGVPRWDSLPLEMNWKSYWEYNASARVVHFHGPKPFQRNHIDSHYPEIKHLSGGGYSELCDRWEELLEEANRAC